MDLNKNERLIITELLKIAEEHIKSGSTYPFCRDLLPAIAIKSERRPADPEEQVSKLLKKIESSDVHTFPSLSDEEIAIEDKVCPDCKGQLEYDKPDPSGNDADIYYCSDCTRPRVSEVKEYHLSYERIFLGYHVEIC